MLFPANHHMCMRILIMATASSSKRRNCEAVFKLMETKAIPTSLDILTTKRMMTSLLATRLLLKTAKLCTV